MLADFWLTISKCGEAESSFSTLLEFLCIYEFEFLEKKTLKWTFLYLLQ